MSRERKILDDTFLLHICRYILDLVCSLNLSVKVTCCLVGELAIGVFDHSVYY